MARAMERGEGEQVLRNTRYWPESASRELRPERNLVAATGPG
jgi:hypothetical protein